MRIQDKRWLAATGLLVTLMGASVQAADKKRHAPTREEILADAKSGASRQRAIDQAMTRVAHDEDAEVRARAAETLGKMKVTAAVPVLTAALGDDANAVRAAAAEALWNLAPDSKPAVPALEKALQDEAAMVRVEAAGALVALDAGPAPRLIPVLEKLLGDKDLAPRAATVLVDLDPGNAAVRTALMGALARGGPDTREAIFDRMAETEMTADAALPFVPALAQAIRSDASPAVRRAAMGAAQNIVPLPDDLLAALQAATTDRDLLVGATAVQAIQEAVAKARERAVKQARSVDEARRAAGMDVEDTVGNWAKALRTGATEDERVMTAEAIGAMGTGGPDVDIDAFAVVLSETLPLERSPRVRAAIAEALGDLAGIKAAKATAAAALRAALKDADPAVRQAAQKALPRVGAH
jgi:HEAT repeat protein